MKRRPVQIALALVLALIATGAVYAYVKHADQRAVAGKQAVDVQLVVKPIPAGISGKDLRDGGYLQIDHLPSDSVPADAVRSIGSDLLDQVTTSDIAAGQVLLPQMLGTKTPTTSGLPIPKNKMAVSIAVDAPADVAGYVQPGAQIAVFDTVILTGPHKVAGDNSNGSKDDNWTTKLLLPRVDVLAASAGAPSKENAGMNNGTASQQLLVTVAVDQTEAQRLIHETERGNLYLALLSQSSVTAPGPGIDSQGTDTPVFPDWAHAS
ncbi:MAG: Flp pilus assembly protein CpaB [Jatrophihabitans sp.]|uniref:Flp pilus assembly protein CpaB n=1 Tax=Jatrophihabitans sp. TaxID=1932789 RepID=UPI003F811657